MFTKFKLLILAATLIFAYGSTSNVPTTHIITLNVDTGKITSTNTDETANFGQEQDVANRDFTTIVKNGDIVLWKGVSSSSPDNDQVLIEAINYEGGTNVFGQNTLKDTRQNPGIVVGTVTEGENGDREKYTISFKVLNNGVKRGGTYLIDPQIMVKLEL
ncbi:hypothetical protein [Christiangramia fulva]|nr:hypothetical protein [Christiangramia fulva]